MTRATTRLTTFFIFLPSFLSIVFGKPLRGHFSKPRRRTDVFRFFEILRFFLESPGFSLESIQEMETLLPSFPFIFMIRRQSRSSVAR